MVKNAAQGRGASPKAKRAKMDPTEKKVASLIHALQDPEQVGLVEMPDVEREMLVKMIPGALGKDAPKDTRHEYQTRIADVVGSAFTKTVEIWEGKLAEANTFLSTADVSSKEKEAVKSAAASVLEEKSKELRSTKLALQAAQEAVVTATGELTEAQHAVDNSETEKRSKEEKKAYVTTLFKDHFEVLKAGDGDKKLLAPVIALCRELNAEASLIDAVSSSFLKKVDVRGEFDIMVVDQVNEVLTKHMAELDEYLNTFEKNVEKLTKVSEEKKLTLETAKQKRLSCVQAVKAADAVKGEVAAKFQEAEDVQKDFAKKLSNQEVEVAVIEGSVFYAKDNLKTFNFLYDRTAPAPEPEAVEAASEAAAGEQPAMETA